MKGLPDSVIYYNRKALDAAYQEKDTLVMVEASSQLGILHAKKHQYKEALQHYEEAIRLSTLTNAYQKMPMLYMNIALLYETWGNNELSFCFAQKAEQAAKELENHKIYASILSQISAIYVKIEQYPEAIHAAKKSISLTKDIPIRYYIALEALAITYAILHQPDSSEVYLSKMEKCLEEGYHVNPSRYYDTKGHVLLQQNKYSEAIPFLEKALDFRETTDKHTEKATEQQYRFLSEAYEKGPKNYQKALFYKQLQLNLTDSIHQKRNADAMAEFDVKYQMAEKELEISNLQLEQQKLLYSRTLVIAGMILLAVLLLTVWLYLRWKRKMEIAVWKKKNEEKDLQYHAMVSEMEKKQLQSYMEGLETERSRLAKEMHDSVANGLLAVQMKMQSPNASPDDINQMMKKLHNQIREISHALLPPVFRYASLPEIMDGYVCDQNTSGDGPVFEFYLSPENGWEYLPHSTALTLYRIIQEACGNALKHAGARNIVISLCREGNCIELSVSDDGAGFQVYAKRSSGMGLHIIRERVNEQNGMLNIISEPGKGTCIKVVIESIDNDNWSIVH